MLPYTNDREILSAYAVGDDPFAFLVVEQIIKQRSLSRVPEVKSTDMFWSRKRQEYDDAMDSYREVVHLCNGLWANLVFRLMQIQVDSTLLPYEAELERRKRYQQHLDDLQEMEYGYELEVKRQDISERLDPLRAPAQERRKVRARNEQEILNIESDGMSAREANRLRQTNLADLEYQRSLFEQVTAQGMKLNNEHQKEMKVLEQDFLERLSEVIPDPDDPAHRAGRERLAYNIYTDMIREVTGNTDLDSDQRNRQVRMIIEMATKR